MLKRSRITAGAAVASLFAACALPHDEAADAGSVSVVTRGGSGSSPGGASSSGGGTSVGLESACRAGIYEGSVTGSYFSALGSGEPLSVSGKLELTLDPVGTSSGQCTLSVTGEGLTTESCNNLFTISAGTMTGLMTLTVDGAALELPYSCAVSGALSCVERALENGWAECTYCDGQISEDAGCGAAGGGRFAGPLAATYDTLTLGFASGVWNGAEALAGNDGGEVPGPEGGPFYDYLALDGGYGGGDYGGSGAWSASCLNCP